MLSFMLIVIANFILLTFYLYVNEIYALSTMLLLQMTGLFQFTVRMAIDTEARFTSVERLAQYEKVQPLMLINQWDVVIECYGFAYMSIS